MGQLSEKKAKISKKSKKFATKIIKIWLKEVKFAVFLKTPYKWEPCLPKMIHDNGCGFLHCSCRLPPPDQTKS